MIYSKQKAKSYIFYLLSIKSRTKKEIIDKLKRKEYNIDIINEAIKEVEELDYINDKKYALDFASDSLNFKKYGKNLVKRKLFLKGIDKNTIDETIEKVFGKVNEFDMAYDLAKRKLRSYGKKDNKTLARRLQGFLIRRGYSFDAAIKTIKKIFKELEVNE